MLINLSFYDILLQLSESFLFLVLLVVVTPRRIDRDNAHRRLKRQWGPEEVNACINTDISSNKMILSLAFRIHIQMRDQLSSKNTTTTDHRPPQHQNEEILKQKQTKHTYIKANTVTLFQYNKGLAVHLGLVMYWFNKDLRS